MGLLDKVKKALGSKEKGDVLNKNNEEITDTSELVGSLENDKIDLEVEETQTQDFKVEKIQSKDFEDTSIINDENDEATVEVNTKFEEEEPCLIKDSINFKGLDELIHSDAKEITLDFDVVLDKNEVSEYIDGIRLDVDDLVIDGNNHKIDACNETRIFMCIGKGITIKNLTLENGFSYDNGGAIDNSSDLTISNSVFNGNKANGSGGAIFNRGDLFLSNSLLKYNRAIEKDGGAIYNYEEGRLSIIKSDLSKNTAKMKGGAIDNWGEVTITKSTLSSNTVRFNGGALYNHYDNKLIIEKTMLNKNTAIYGDGGAIFNKGILKLEKCELSENKAKENGGAINHENRNCKIYDCIILSNTSPKNIILNQDSFEIYNTDFKDNETKDIILNKKSKESNLSVSYSNFIENKTNSIIFNNGKSCTVQSTSFENNLSKRNSKNIINKRDLILISPKIRDDGKTILNEGYLLLKNSSKDVIDKIEDKNTVEILADMIPSMQKFDFGYLDKIIHQNTAKEIVLEKDICFETYEKDFYEGGIELDIDDLVIDGNGKTIDGADKSRIFLISGNNITLKNIAFKNGHSHKNYNNLLNNNGGAIKINHGKRLRLENCEFISNKSEEHGGAISNHGELDITNSKLNNNITAENGGVIYNFGTMTITNSKLNKNRSKNAGAIYNNGKVTITKSSLLSNTSTLGYGAINNEHGEVIITESKLNTNSRAIYNNDKVTITKSILNNNKLGAIENHGIINIIESALKNNKDGAINNERGNVTIVESTFSDNEAKWNDGGAITNYKGELNIKKSIFNHNVAKIVGGAIWTEKSKYKLSNCTFKDNKPDDVYESD